MFEGDLVEGELEIGQVSSQMNKVKPASEIVADVILEFNKAKEGINSDKFNFK